MKKISVIMLFAVFFACGFALGTSPGLNIDDKSTLESRIALELSTILDKFLGAEKSHVTVFIDAEAESINDAASSGKDKKGAKNASNKKGRGSVQQWLWKDMARRPRISVMPGFMLPQEVTVTQVEHKDSAQEAAKAKEAKADTSVSEPPIIIRIKRVVVSVVLDRSISDQDLEKVKVLAAEILGLSPERGDVLNVYRLSFVPWWKQLFTNAVLFERLLPFLLWGLMILGGIMLLSFLVQRQLDKWMAFSHPGKKISITKPAQSAAATQEGSPGEGGTPGKKNAEKIDDESETEPVEVSVEPGFQKPFVYINSDNIERLATLLQELGYSASSIAIILGFLPVDLRTTLLQNLELKLQEQVMQLMCRMRKVVPEMLATFDAQLKETIAHSYGGTIDTTAWMEMMPAAQCEAYLNFLEKVDPGKAEEIRSRLIRFEDLLGLSAEQLPTLVHAVAVKEWGLALSGIGAAGDRLLAIMPTESQNALRQRLGLEHPTPEDVLHARSRILTLAREFAHQGRLKLSAGPRPNKQTPGVQQIAALKADDGIHELPGSPIPFPPSMRPDK